MVYLACVVGIRFNLNSEIELKIMRHFLLAGQISEKLAQANVKGW